MIGYGTSCGACKFLRRRCCENCVFAPYFCYDEAAATFAAVHKVFGASNVSKILSHLPEHNRGEAAITISYEALARMDNPIYGCVSHIFALQQQVISLREEIETLEIQMASQFINDNNHINNGLHFPPKIVFEDSSHQNEMFAEMEACQIGYENQIISQNGNSLVDHDMLHNQANVQPSQAHRLEEQISLQNLCLNHLEIFHEAAKEEGAYMRFPSRLGLIDEIV